MSSPRWVGTAFPALLLLPTAASAAAAWASNAPDEDQEGVSLPSGERTEPRLLPGGRAAAPRENASLECFHGSCSGCLRERGCRWCYLTGSCHVFGSLLDSCEVPLSTEGECWAAGYNYQLGAYLSTRPDDVEQWLSQTLATYRIAAARYPTYPNDTTGLFDLATGAPLADSAGGGPAVGVGVAGIGDWGSGTGVADAVGQLTRRTSPQVSLHLGDVYYVGTPEQFRTNVAGEPRRPGLRGVEFPRGSHTTFLLNGNHEMISGGHGLFEDGFRFSGQQAPFAVWQSDHWRFVALDTGYRCYVMDSRGQRQFNLETRNLAETNAPQPQEVVDWLVQVVRLGDPADKRGVVLFTHHNPLSLFGSSVYLGTAKQLNDILPANKTVLWFFGHEHGLALFDVVNLSGTRFNVLGRLVGNGGYPDTFAAKPEPHIAGYDRRVYQRIHQFPFSDAQIGFNGFFMIRVTGPTLEITYTTTKCRPSGCGDGPDFAEGTVVAAEEVTVDPSTGRLQQRFTSRGPSGGGLTWVSKRAASSPPARVSPVDTTPEMSELGGLPYFKGRD